MEHPDVVEDIPADDAGGHPIVVGELDVDARSGADGAVRLSRVRDHMGIREDRAARGDDKARALGGGAPEVGEDGDDTR